MSTILVTGATDGLGRALAHELVARGHEVVVHGRSRERAEAVAKEIGGAEIVVADFARLDDVRAVRVQGIDVLVNNADIIAAERRLSEDGIELTFQVNHLAGFLLALQMLPPRTVNVASIGQRAPDFDDLMLERGYEGYDAYARSKLAQIMFTFELARPPLAQHRRRGGRGDRRAGRARRRHRPLLRRPRRVACRSAGLRRGGAPAALGRLRGAHVSSTPRSLSQAVTRSGGLPSNSARAARRSRSSSSSSISSGRCPR